MTRSTFAFKMTLICSLILFMLFSWGTALEFSMCKIGMNKECDNLKQNLTNHKIKCVSAPNIYRCMQLLKMGKIDVLGVSDTDLYPAGKFMDLKPFLQEVLHGDKTYRYKAVFAIKPKSNIKDLKSLKDKKSCHTGAGKTTGWTVPVSNLLKKKIIPIKDCYSTVTNVEDFFDESCIPGAYSPRFNPFGTNRPAACALCGKGNCLMNDTYAKYDGALKCLLEGNGDIAFISNNELGGKNNLQLLCPDGNVKNESDYEACNWGTRPSDVFVSSPKLDGSKLTEITKVLKDNSGIIKSYLSIFKDSEGFKKTDKDYKKIMGDGFLNTFESYHNCEKNLKWCTMSDKEMSKCVDLKLAFAAKRATSKLECVKAKDGHDCIHKIIKKEADFVVLDGGLIGDALKDCPIRPGISENHILDKHSQEASYYAVAVVKKSSKWRFPNLKGAKTCHTGYGKTSGWKVPVALLVSNKQIENGDLPINVGKYFKESCVPGILEKKNNPNGNNPKSLCALCPDSGKECSASSKNKYYGYTGAFRCLVESGEVAFVKHTTVSESTDGHGTEDWEKDLKSDNYELLCPDGSRTAVTNWLKCNLAKVPAHAMIFREDETMIKRMYSVFSYMDLGSQETKDLLFHSFDGKNLLFKDSAIGLSYIEKPDKFITPEYKKILDVFGSKKKICSTASTLYGTFTLLLITIITLFF